MHRGLTTASAHSCNIWWKESPTGDDRAHADGFLAVIRYTLQGFLSYLFGGGDTV